MLNRKEMNEVLKIAKNIDSNNRIQKTVNNNVWFVSNNAYYSIKKIANGHYVVYSKNNKNDVWFYYNRYVNNTIVSTIIRNNSNTTLYLMKTLIV